MYFPYLGLGLISWPFLYHLRSTVGSARSTTRRIFPPLSTWYAGSSFFAKAVKKKKEWTFLIKLIKPRKCSLAIRTLPSLFFSSFGIFFILRSRPLRSVMPYMKAIFSYSSGRAFFRISHTSTSGVSSCCLCSLVVPHPREHCEGREHWRVFATCPEEPLSDSQKKTFLLALLRLRNLLQVLPSYSVILFFLK